MKILILKIIKFIPFNVLKTNLLKFIFGYKTGKGVKIGKSIINCKKVRIGNNVYIVDRNVFSCEEIEIGANTKIHSGNRFIGKSKFTIGQDLRIINDHYFDLWKK